MEDDGSNDCFIDNNGRVLIAGYYNSSTLTFGNTDLDNSYVGISTSDVFVANTCNAVRSTDTRTACNSFTWMDGNTYTAGNNTAVFNIAGNANACDSLLTLNLTILNATIRNDTQTVCNAYTWIDGNTYISSTNSATFNIVGGAANTCNSLVTLDLTINEADVSITTTAPSITSNAANATYRWLDCDNNFVFLQGETAQTFTATTNGNYAVEVMQNSCTDTSACVAISAVGVLETSSFNQVTISPNPNNGMVNLDLGSLKDVTVNVINLSGQLVHTEENIRTPAYHFELKEAAGVYLVEVISKSEKQQYKLMVK